MSVSEAHENVVPVTAVKVVHRRDYHVVPLTALRWLIVETIM